MTTDKQPKITLRGRAALESGLPLFVEDLAGHWVPAGPLARDRAARMPDRAKLIYGVEARRTKLVPMWQVGYVGYSGTRRISTRLYTYDVARKLVSRLRKLGNDAYLAGSIRVRRAA